MATRGKRKLKIDRLLFLLLIVIILAFLGFKAYEKYGMSKSGSKKVKNISSIKGYGYNLRENATPYYKSLFKKLNSVLSKDEVDEEAYMNLECQMFVADFFNLDNKLNKNDVGGSEFVYKDYQIDFKKAAMDSVYRSVLNNVYDGRNQKLPIVSKVTCTKVGNEAFKYGDSSDDNAYSVNFKVEYKDDLGYQEEGNLTIIHSDKKLEVAAMSTEEK